MMLNGELEVERYCEEIIDGNKGVKWIHGDDKYGRHIFDDDRKGGKRVHEKDKGSGMMAGDFFAHLKKIDKIRHDFLMMANTMIGIPMPMFM